MECPFCNYERAVLSNDLAFAIYDRYPVNKGHMLIIPKRHFPDFFQATVEERKALSGLLDLCRKHIDEIYHPDGYNIGVNCGRSAGQTIWHVHIHLIPRYTGDIDNPTGGVRGVIPAKRIYQSGGEKNK